MIAGDLVRFEPTYLEVYPVHERPVAIVIDITPWEKMVTLLHAGTVYRVGTSRARALEPYNDPKKLHTLGKELSDVT